MSIKSLIISFIIYVYSFVILIIWLPIKAYLEILVLVFPIYVFSLFSEHYYIFEKSIRIHQVIKYHNQPLLQFKTMGLICNEVVHIYINNNHLSLYISVASEFQCSFIVLNQFLLLFLFYYIFQSLLLLIFDFCLLILC